MLSPPPNALSRGERISHTSATSDLCDFLCEGSDEETGSVSSGQWPDRPAHEAQIEVCEELTHAEFNESFRHQKPVLLRGFASCWPALSRWQDPAHLRSMLPEDMVLVLRAKDNRRFLKRDCTHEKWAWSAVADELFSDELQSQPPDRVAAAAASASDGSPAQPETEGARRMYARAPLHGALRAEVALEGLEALVGGAPGAHRFREQNCGAWLGSAGCVTPLHYDLCHGFLVGVRGTKRITYYCPDDYRSLYARTEQPELSTVDLDAWRQGEATEAGQNERRAHPRFAEATAWHAELRPGDVLYTPPYWWHHVETTAEAAALSVLVPFDPRPEERVHACHFR